MTQEFIPSTVTIREIFAHGDSASYEDSVAAFDCWLAAHDAQIQAEAMELTDEEADIAAEALDDADDESWYYDDKQQVIRDVLKAVASFRTEQK